MSVVAQVLAGVLIGYVVVSLCESFFHRTVGHASPRLRRLARGLGAIGSGVIEVWYGHHVVHHCRTFRRDHVTQFESAHAEQRLRCELIAKGRRRMVAESYGARVGGGEAADHVEHDVALVPVARHVQRGHAGVATEALVARDIALGRLDLDHVRTQFGQDLCGVGRQHDAAHLDHAHALQRFPHGSFLKDRDRHPAFP